MSIQSFVHAFYLHLMMLFFVGVPVAFLGEFHVTNSAFKGPKFEMYTVNVISQMYPASVDNSTAVLTDGLPNLLIWVTV